MKQRNTGNSAWIVLWKISTGFYAVGADIASATALPVLADGLFNDVTGTTTFTSINALGIGSTKYLQFDGALTVTHHATDLVLPQGKDILTQAGQILGFYEYAAGDWRLIFNSFSSTIGKHTIWIPANAWRPTTSNGCAAIADIETTAGNPDVQALAFDASADEHAQVGIMFPKSWNLGTLTFQPQWTTSGAVSTGVAIALQGIAVSDNESIDQVFSGGTPVVVTDDAQGAAYEQLTAAESTAVTIGGTPADFDMVYLRLFRDVSDGNDDMTQDMLFIGTHVTFNTDQGEDT